MLMEQVSEAESIFSENFSRTFSLLGVSPCPHAIELGADKGPELGISGDVWTLIAGRKVFWTFWRFCFPPGQLSCLHLLSVLWLTGEVREHWPFRNLLNSSVSMPTIFCPFSHPTSTTASYLLG